MHGDPELWQQLTDRLAAMAVASLRAQIEAGAQAVQLFDSWAGSLAPDEYARFALPATGPSWPASPTSVSRPSSSASAPVSSWPRWAPPDPMSSASTGGSRSTRHAGASAADTRCRATSTPRSAWRRGPWWPKRADRCWPAPQMARARPISTWATLLPETDPGILSAVVELVHAETARA